MAKFGKFFSILVGLVLILVPSSEAKTVTKTASERSGIAVGGGMSLGDCYFAQTGVNASETETTEGKVVSLSSSVFAQVIIYYTCGKGGLEAIFEASGNDNVISGDLVVSGDKRAAWLRKNISITDKNGFLYLIEIDVAVIADSEPWLNDNRNKGWNKSKSFQQTTHTVSQYHNGRAFGTIMISGFNYLDNGAGYIFSEESSSTVINK